MSTNNQDSIQQLQQEVKRLQRELEQYRHASDGIPAQQLIQHYQNAFANCHDINSLLFTLGRLSGSAKINNAYVMLYDKQRHAYDYIGLPVEDELFAQNSQQGVEAHYPWLASELAKGQTVIFNHLHELPAQADKDRQSFASIDIQSAIFVPMLDSDGTPIGELTFANAGSPHHWNASDIAFAEGVAEAAISAALRTGVSLDFAAGSNLLNSICAITNTAYVYWSRVNDNPKPTDSLLKLLGYENHKLPNIDLKTLAAKHMQPEHQQQLSKKIQLCLNTGSAYSGDFPIVDAQQQPGWLRFKCEGVVSEKYQQPLYFICTITDITPYVNQQQALKNAQQQAEDANTAKSDFLARMSHEIRTPMNAIIGMAHLLEGTRLTADQQEQLYHIDNAANNLLHIINDILDFSKIEAGKLELEKAPIDMEKLFAQLARMMDIPASKNKLELIFDIAPQIPKFIIGDTVRLNQVLINLLSNAIKFTPAGQVSLQLRIVEQNDQHIRLSFSVTDTGIGLTEQQIEYLFSAFSQADSSITRRYGGTGLGLAISQRLVELMQGKLQVESKPLAGSTFSFEASFEAADDTEPLCREVSLDSLKELRALIVDDNPVAREVMEHLCARLGMRIDQAEDGQQALRAIYVAQESNDPYDVILLDYSMPNLDGLTVAERLKHNPNHHAPTVIMISAFELNQLESERRDNIDAFIAKPVNPSRFFDTMASLFVRPSHPAPVTIKKALPVFKNIHVLIAEDNPVNQKVVLGMLKRVGITGDIANNGDEACAMFEANPGKYQMIFMDLEMPHVGGHEATRKLRATDIGKYVPIIALTAHAIAGEAERCQASGMNDYLTKPLKAQLLYECIEQFNPAKQTES